MKSLVGGMLSRLHIIILLYAAYTTWEAWDQHETRRVEIESQLPGIEEELAKYRTKLKEIDSYRKDVENSRKRVEEVFRSIEKVQRQLPLEVSDIEVLDYLAKEGRSLNITNLEPTPQPENPQGFYVAKPYSIKARGTFLQFVIFLERLSLSERLFNVQSVAFNSDLSAQKGRFHMIDMRAVIETFRYNSDHKENSGIEEIEAQFKGPAGEGAPRRRRRGGGGGRGDGGEE
jgi:Tfp pilus assembly protein PilO